MLVYTAKRCLAALALVYVVASIVFLSLYLVPGDPAEVLLSTGGVAPPQEAVDELRRQLGLDKPLLHQYGAYLTRIVQGDLGTSFGDGTPVAESIMQRLPRTLELVAAATGLAVLIGVPLGVWAALRRGRLMDRLLSFIASLSLSIPVFVLGTTFILVFSQQLKLLPAGGYVPFAISPWRHLVSLLMPATVIAVGLVAVVFRMMRTTVLGVLDRDWVRTARAKGLSARKVLMKHVVRNALGPVATVIGLEMGALLGGTVLVEFVFNWPGLSGMLVTAVENRDYPEVQGVVLVIAVLFIVLNLVVDLLYSVLDPRVRYE
ncbi:ABC transporter permease [Chelatococcus sp. GCM10030263]|uniref:ABC transporter permease n=1 Tax=Chelatococcus sp. GCM10030263 TaxID=3273387 RepID=UPI00362305B2